MNLIQIRVVFDRKKIATKTKAGLIQLEVTFNGKRKFISTGIKVLKHQFRNGRICQHVNADDLNEQINLQVKEINDVVKSFNERKLTFRLDALDNINKGYSGIDFLAFLEKRITERTIESSTKNQHMKVLRMLRNEYRLIRDFQDLTPSNLSLFDEWLHRRNIGTPECPKHMLQPSIHFYHKTLKHYINEAKLFGYMLSNPYDQLRIDRGESRDREILTMEEIDKVSSFRSRSILANKVRDLFIVQCYTGLAYADLMTMDFRNSSAVNGVTVIKDTRQKTGSGFFITLLPRVVDILERYNWRLPHLSYDVYNRNLKAIILSCGIDKHVTTHTGRHTFATTIALGAGIPIEVVSKMLGHKDIKTTQIYAKIMPEQVLEGFNKIRKHIS